MGYANRWRGSHTALYILRYGGLAAATHLATLPDPDRILVAVSSARSYAAALADIYAVAARLGLPQPTPIAISSDPASTAAALAEALQGSTRITAYIDAPPTATAAALAALLALRAAGARIDATLTTGEDEAPQRLDPTPLLAALQGLPPSLHETLHALLEARASTPHELALRLHVSETTAEKRLRSLRALGLAARRGRAYTPTPWAILYRIAGAKPRRRR